MDYRIVDREEFKVFGKSITIGLEDNPFEVIPKFWEDFQEDGTYQYICRTAGFEPYSGISLHAAAYDFVNNGTYKQKYMIFANQQSGIVVPNDLDTLTIPPSKWGVFSARYETVEESVVAIQQLWKRVFSEWFPTANYEVADGPQLEVYPEDSKTVEIWIPIK
ncbi:effector binding domain-containing protein [Bacillaceae bacterium S4-13-58]